jgi:hypothetical protein
MTGSKINHTNGAPIKNQGKIEWLQFSVEIVLPSGSTKGRTH